MTVQYTETGHSRVPDPEGGSVQSQCTAANDKANCTGVVPMKLLSSIAMKNKYNQVVYRLV